MANKSNFGLKLGLGLVALVVVVVIVLGTLRPVAKVALVTHGKAVNAVPGSVVVTAGRISQLTSEIGGRIQKSELEPGSVVKEGEVLVQIDAGDIDLVIEKIKIDLQAKQRSVAAGSAIRFEYETAEEAAQNAERQHARGGLSDQDLAQKKRAVEAIKLRMEQEAASDQQVIDTYENQLKVNQRQHDKMTITAPFDGVVSLVSARKYDLIGNNYSIATLISVSRRVEAKISEENFASVQTGQRAVVRFLTYGDKQFEATVEKKLPTAEAGTQRYIAYLDVKIDPDKLLPDLTGEVSIVVGEHEAKALVPRRAVFDGFVFVVKDGRVERRKLTLGYTSLNSAEVLEGLQPDDEVIVDELDQFHPGDRVRTEVVK
jgi:RND family efflux transporter MFP subunit